MKEEFWIHIVDFSGKLPDFQLFLKENGLKSYINYQNHNNFCYFSFDSLQSAQEVFNFLSKNPFNQKLLKVNLSNLPNNNKTEQNIYKKNYLPYNKNNIYKDNKYLINPSKFENIDPKFSRTIEIKGYPSNILTRRKLFEDFRSCGYIKQIEIKENIGFIQFDTIDDAKTAQLTKNGFREGIIVDFIPDRPLNLPKFEINLIISERNNNSDNRIPNKFY